MHENSPETITITNPLRMNKFNVKFLKSIFLNKFLNKHLPKNIANEAVFIWIAFKSNFTVTRAFNIT